MSKSLAILMVLGGFWGISLALPAQEEISTPLQLKVEEVIVVAGKKQMLTYNKHRCDAEGKSMSARIPDQTIRNHS